MPDQTGLTPFVLKERVGENWRVLAPLTHAGQVILPDGRPLEQYMEETDPSQKLATITHNLGGYPLVLLLALQYGAGTQGAGIGPAGGSDPVKYPCTEVYHNSNSLTVYTVRRITEIGEQRTLTKVSPCEYLLTFDGVNAESCYVKLVLNMGAGGSTIPAQFSSPFRHTRTKSE